MSTEVKAIRYLAEGRVKAQHVSESTALFHVTGSEPGDPYFVKFSKHGGWKCDCPARVPDCAHVRACRLVTDLQAVPLTGQEVARDPELDSLLGG